jgi:hypothetical protein
LNLMFFRKGESKGEGKGGSYKTGPIGAEGLG